MSHLEVHLNTILTFFYMILYNLHNFKLFQLKINEEILVYEPTKSVRIISCSIYSNKIRVNLTFFATLLFQNHPNKIYLFNVCVCVRLR